MTTNSNEFGYIFTWTIKNYSLWYQMELRQVLNSPKFTVESLDNSQWKLKLRKENCDILVLDLWREDSIEASSELIFDSKISVHKENYPNNYFKKCGSIFKGKDFIFHPFLAPVHTDVNYKISLEDTLVIKCHMYNNTIKDLVKCSVVTQIPMEKHDIFLPIYCISDTIFVSKNKVSLKSISDNYPLITIHLIKQHEDVDLKIKISEWHYSVFIRCEINIQDLNDSRKTLYAGNHWFKTETWINSWNLPNIFQSVMSDLKYSGPKSHTMEIKLLISDAGDQPYIENIVSSYTMHDSKQTIQAPSEYLLCKQLEKLYFKERLCDFTIKCDNREFKIHKGIFGAVSPVFCAMFEVNMSEKKDSTVTIEDIDSDTLEKLIQFVYTTNVNDLNWSDTQNLYAAANKYQMMELKNTCAQILISKLDVENVLDALVFADLYEDQTLMKRSKQMISEKGKKVLRSEKGRSFMTEHPRIACEVMHEILFPSTKFS